MRPLLLISLVVTALVIGGGAERAQSQSAASTFPSTTTALQHGFNLIGWTGPPIDPAILAQCVGAALDAIFAWDADTEQFRTYRPGAPAFLNDLDVIESGAGIWVLADWSGASLDIPTLPLPDGVSLRPGLNLVAWSGLDGIAVADAIASAKGSIASVSAFDAAARQFRSFSPAAPAVVNTLGQLTSAQGLWVQATSATA